MFYGVEKGYWTLLTAPPPHTTRHCTLQSLLDFIQASIPVICGVFIRTACSGCKLLSSLDVLAVFNYLADYRHLLFLVSLLGSSVVFLVLISLLVAYKHLKAFSGSFE